MKSINLFSVAILATIFLFSCKKEDAKINTEENPVKATIAANQVVDSVFSVKQGSSYENGFKIYFSKNGVVKQLGCRTPQTGNFTVSLWDFATKKLLASVKIAVADTARFTYVAVEPIDVIANTKYVLSANNTDGAVKQVFYAVKKNSVVPLFPFTTGSITFEDFRNAVSPKTVFPALSSNPPRLISLPDLTFEPTVK